MRVLEIADCPGVLGGGSPRETSRRNPDACELWLDPRMQIVSEASDLLKPFDARPMRCALGQIYPPPLSQHRRNPFWTLIEVVENTIAAFRI
jgi:hypothetical protein